jgi:hypothetical protein
LCYSHSYPLKAVAFFPSLKENLLQITVSSLLFSVYADIAIEATHFDMFQIPYIY